MLDTVKANVLEQLLAYIQNHFPQGRAAQISAFASEYYRWIAPEDLSERGPGDLYGAMIAHWKLSQHRGAQECKARVYTPRSEEHGWQSPHTVIEITTNDMPFLVDSLSMEISRQGYTIHFIIAPIISIRRDAQGQLLEVFSADANSEGTIPEAYLHIEVDQQREPARQEELRQGLVRVLEQVRIVVEDWPMMQQILQQSDHELGTIAAPIDQEEITEARTLLTWLKDGNFIFMGYRTYDLLLEDGKGRLFAVPGTGLGILRETRVRVTSHGTSSLPSDTQTLDLSRHPLILTKANSRAPIHRPSYMDYIGIKRFDADGRIIGERRFLGLYTTAPYHAHPRDIPVVRRKFNHILTRSTLPVGGHYYKALSDILETYPRDELFQTSEDELFAIAMSILRIRDRPQIRLFIRRDPYDRFLSCLVYLPRDQYNSENRLCIQRVLQQQLHGVSLEHTEYVTQSMLARLHIIIYTNPGDIPVYDVQAIEKRLAEAIRSWTGDLQAALINEYGEEGGNRLFQRYRNAFPTAYRAEFSARATLPDITWIEHLMPEGDLSPHLYKQPGEPEHSLRFKLLRCGQPMTLSSILPILETLSVRVVDEHPYEIRPEQWPTVWMYDLGLVYTGEEKLDTERVKELFQEAFSQAWRNNIETDGFNRLVLRAQLSGREIVVLRAYSKYLRQTGSLFSQAYTEQSLINQPRIAHLLIELFQMRFDPRNEKNAQAQARLVEEIEQAINMVPSLDEDRILHSFLHLIQATLRTNFFQWDANQRPKPYLSFKLDPSRIPNLPLPRPQFEIFVYSPRMDGMFGPALTVAGRNASDATGVTRTV
jgi:glutamate dehydrogenase